MNLPAGPGVVFTRRWVVDFVLDLAGYTPDRDLGAMVAVEPACGGGAFLEQMVSRLSASCRAHGRNLGDAIRAFDLLPHNVEASQRVIEKVLSEGGWKSAAKYATAWVEQDDYLLRQREEQSADFVLGNPPYIRLEDIPQDRLAAYRDACSTMAGRSDVYIGFYEVALRSLKPEGVVGFICADRWMRNRYGARLRRLIAAHYSVDFAMALHDVDVFDRRVAAYPAISIIRKAPQGPAVVADTRRAFLADDAMTVVAWKRNPASPPIANGRFEIGRLPHWFSGGDSWPSGSPARLALIEDLNDRFPLLEDRATATRVGIGVATGADSVFVTSGSACADVEPDRLLPLSMVRDTKSGGLAWSGHHLVNPWDANGELVDLAAYPRLQAHFERHSSALRQRYVARLGPEQWYRTIDKIDHCLTARPKLLFPDLKNCLHPVLDEGGLYPHHNLYYVVSDAWDLRVLGGLLLSGVAQAFVEAYAVKMRGGTMRFQAQYLRRIRVPHPESLSASDRAALARAFADRDIDAASEVATRVYGVCIAAIPK
ncbi:type II DNA modification methyltransferase [Rhizocola hellebori]|uniref:site-specific DNA-methyltransferase (adenine-specific) n=1 Tax=Rhizocola hellebori TaxID=1392758 RepID=A0A8J3QE14_9ACTN|nr:Eco57I restriction-modification methylase domain-containing protein [Rhizocola hellebori]GIH09001.1 type II DNA modification methyltransferase [Rhizocola hellebori]